MTCTSRWRWRRATASPSPSQRGQTAPTTAFQVRLGQGGVGGWFGVCAAISEKLAALATNEFVEGCSEGDMHPHHPARTTTATPTTVQSHNLWYNLQLTAPPLLVNYDEFTMSQLASNCPTLHSQL